jgi:tetratricopeptide (TPR) repeat protein
MEESVRSLAETGVLIGDKGSYTLAQKIENIRMPSKVQTVLADRIDRLPLEQKHLLQTAAVIGVKVPLRVLSAVAELPDSELHQHLASLQSAEFLYESNLFPEQEYTFKHALTNEVVYSALLRERKTSLHARIVTALEAMAGDNLHDYIETLAHHAQRGEVWDKAAGYLREAGAKAVSCSGFSNAANYFEQALAALGHLPSSREKLEQAIDVHLDSRNALFLSGDLPRVAQHLHEAEALAEGLGDEYRLARVLNFLNSYYGLAGDPERAIQIGRKTLSLRTTGADRALGAVAHYYLGAAYNKTGQYSEAIEVLKRGMQTVDGALRHERFGTTVVLSVICRSHLVQCLAATGQFTEGIGRGEEGVRIAEEVNHPASLIHMICSLGVLFLSKGDLDKAIPVLERAFAICGSANIPVYVPYAASRLGAAYAHAGRISEALGYLEEGVKNASAAGRVAFLSLSTAWLSQGYLLAGRLQQAATLAERALDLSRKHMERGHEAWVLKLLGDIAASDEPLQADQAESYYRRAIDIGHGLGMRPLRAHCHFGLSKVHSGRGAIEQARSELSTAIDLYGLMEMSFWLHRAEAAVHSLEVRQADEKSGT